ncbi:MAG: DUF6268 family outer membrane beta-barrel protein [Bacteroidota bacterium]
MRISKSLLITCGLGMICFSVKGQIPGPKVTINTFATLPSSFSDTIGQYATQRANIGFSVPVYRKMLASKGESPSVFLAFLNGEFEIQRREIGPFDDERLFITPWVGTTMLYSNGEKSTFISNIRVRWREDEFTDSNPKLFPDAAVIWKYQKNEQWSYTAGLAYTYAFGAGFPVPMLGFSKSFRNDGQLTVILPLSVSYQKRTKHDHTYQLFLRPNGDVARFGNNDVFSEHEDDDLLIRERGMQLGASYSFPLGPLQIEPEVGLLTNQNLSFASSDSNLFNPAEIYSSGIQSTMYGALKLTFNINRKGARPNDSSLNDQSIGF